jgi:hypothetical protein
MEAEIPEASVIDTINFLMSLRRWTVYGYEIFGITTPSLDTGKTRAGINAGET